MATVKLGYSSLEEVPASIREHCIVAEDGSVNYDDSKLHNTLRAQRDAENAAKDKAAKLEQELAKLKKPDEGTDTRPQGNLSKLEQQVAEQSKTIELLLKTQEDNKRQLAETSRSNEQLKAATDAGMDPFFIPALMSEIGYDDEGRSFIKDSDGTRRINSTTGKPMTMAEYFALKVKEKPSLAAIQQGSGPGVAGGGLNSTLQKHLSPLTQAEERDLRQKANDALTKGDQRLYKELHRQALAKGLNL